MACEVETLDAMFWRDPPTLRHGETECLHGHAEIAVFRGFADRMIRAAGAFRSGSAGGRDFRR